MQDNICDSVVHEEAVAHARSAMPEAFLITQLAELFKVFGDTTRARILCALSASELCVCDLSALLGMTQSAISHQLRLLKVSHIVKNRKEGRVVYYSLDDHHIAEIFHMAFEHISEKREG